MLGFDDYPDIAARLRSIVAGETHQSHTPSDRRRLLPISPVDRDACTSACRATRPRPAEIGPGAPATGPRAVRRRLDGGPMAPLKLASGCDRRCSFCAIPSFRGSFVSRRPSDVLQEAQWLADAGRARSSSSSARTPRRTARTSATCGCSRRCCPSSPPSTASTGCGCPTCSRPRPGPGLIEAIADTPGVVPYFDLSFQHASADRAAPDAPLRRPGELPRPARADPHARARRPACAPTSSSASPARPRTTSQTLCDFLEAARMDVTGVFGYSDEDGTEAASYDGKLDEDEVRARTEHVTALVEELNAQRAEERIGETVERARRVRRRTARRGPGRSTRAPRSTARRRSSDCRRAGRRPRRARRSSPPTAST